MSTISLGRKEQVYVQPESVFGSPNAPSGQNAIRHLECKMTLNEERNARDDRKGSRGVAEQVAGKRNLEWSLEGYLIPSGETATEPDIDGLLGCTFEKTITNTATVAAGATTSGATLSSVSAMQAGDIVGFIIDGKMHAVSLQSVNVSTGAVTWAPALPTSPQEGATVHRSVIYRLQTNPDKSATIHRLLDQEAQCGVGCVPSTWTFAVAAGDPAKVTSAGKGKDLLFAGSSTLAVGMNDSQTEFTYSPPDVFEADTFVQIGGEVLRIMSVDEDEHTCEALRAQAGSTAAAHMSGTAIAPYRPTPVTAGSPIAGVKGACLVNGEDFVITAAKATIEENVFMRDDEFGSATAQGYAYPKNREVRLELEGLLDCNGGGLLTAAKRGGTMPVLLQAGDQVGKTFALYAARFQPDIPDIDAPADGEIPLRLAGPALEETGNDEIVIAFL